MYMVNTVKMVILNGSVFIQLKLRKPIGDISLSGLGRDWTLRRSILHLNDI